MGRIDLVDLSDCAGPVLAESDRCVLPYVMLGGKDDLYYLSETFLDSGHACFESRHALRQDARRFNHFLPKVLKIRLDLDNLVTGHPSPPKYLRRRPGV